MREAGGDDRLDVECEWRKEVKDDSTDDDDGGDGDADDGDDSNDNKVTTTTSYWALTVPITLLNVTCFILVNPHNNLWVIYHSRWGMLQTRDGNPEVLWLVHS